MLAIFLQYNHMKVSYIKNRMIMASYNHIKIWTIALFGLILMGIASVMYGSNEWLMATLMISGVLFMGLSGALLIKATWTRNDANRKNKHWSLLDSRLID